MYIYIYIYILGSGVWKCHPPSRQSEMVVHNLMSQPEKEYRTDLPSVGLAKETSGGTHASVPSSFIQPTQD